MSDEMDVGVLDRCPPAHHLACRHVVDAHRKVTAERDTLRAERDEAVAVLRRIADAPMSTHATQEIRSLLSRLEGAGR